MFDLHRSTVCRERIGLRAPYLLCVRYIPVPTDPVNGEDMGIYGFATVVCQIWG